MKTSFKFNRSYIITNQSTNRPFQHTNRPNARDCSDT